MIANHLVLVTPIDAAFLFLAGAGIVMSFTLAFWHHRQNGNRRIPSWIVWLQAMAWILFLTRFIWVELKVVYTNPHPPILLYVIMVALMDAAQVGHIYHLMLRRKHEYKDKESFK